jgi:hypothetical protein
MTQDSSNEKQQAHELIDRLPPAQLSAVVNLLESMLDPVSLAIANAPVEEEEITPETAAALDRARERSNRNGCIPHEQVLAELGITQEEIERYEDRP